MSKISVPFSTETFLRLCAFLEEKGDTRDPVEVVEDAVDYWLENAGWKDCLLSVSTLAPEAQGYMWKNVFLPTETILRIKYGNAFHYAKVEGDAVIYRGKSVSPNQFALKVTKTARDAWRDLWIKRPSDNNFAVAQSLRKEPKPETKVQKLSDITLKDLGL